MPERVKIWCPYASDVSEPDLGMFGVFALFRLSYPFEVLRCVEKPKEPRSNLAVMGVYAFNSSFFEVYPKLKPSWRNEMEISSP